MSEEQPKNKLHGVTLEAIVNELVEHFGGPALRERARAERAAAASRDTVHR